LNLFDNQLIGSISPSFGSLTRLTYFHLGKNRIRHSLPSSLLLLPIQYFNIAQNLFTGSLPHTLGSMTAVVDFVLDTNVLTGSLPSSITLLTQLTRLDLSVNLLRGPIPPQIGSLSLLAHLDLDYNLLTGPVPSTVGSLTSITQFNLEVNRLSGTLPSEFTHLDRLVVLSLFSNSLTGSLPQMEFPLLTWLELHFNHFTGPYPSSLFLSSSLQILSLQHNLFTSSLPCQFNSYSLLSYLDLSSNAFSGWCQDESSMNLSSTMMTLLLSHNFFAHSFPASLLANTIDLETLAVSSNLLTGAIPTVFQTLSRLHRLDLSHNRLEGSVPSLFGEMRQLNQLYLQNNRLTHPLHHIQWSSNLSLVNLDLSSNKLSSSLPSGLFLLPLLETLALTSNCFEGSLPLTLCDSSALRVLSMDGLGAATHCKGHLAIPYSNVELKNSMHGELPRCLWNMTSLKIMSLADNGLIGPLGQLSPNSSLINLTLSHNHLTGTIPRSLQAHEFVSLDLSYNKLVGSFKPKIGLSSRRIVLEVNRLSGDFEYLPPPPSSRNLSRGDPTEVVLDVLTGNIFGCGGLPSADVSHDTYSCGSKTIDQAFIWLAVMLTLMLLLSGAYALKRIARHSSLLRSYDLRLNLATIFPFLRYLFVLHDVVSLSERDTHPLEVRDISHSLQFLSYLERTVGLLLLSCVFFSLPLYLIRAGEGDAYSSHINLYRWEWTAAYLTGTLPAALLLAAWVGVVSVFLYRRGQVSQRTSSSVASSESQSSADSLHETLESLLYVSVNVAVMGTVNAFYILSTTQERNTTEQFLIRLSLAIFNSVWNSICLPLLDSHSQSTPWRGETETEAERDRESSGSISEGEKGLSKRRIKLLVIAINTIFIPCIVTALTSPSCYQVCVSSSPPSPPSSVA
jgi:Leucine-rich repeat (LRR) protein